EPDRGSEPALGWGTAQIISQYHDIWVLTTSDRRPAIEKYYKTHPAQPNIHYVYLDIPYWMRFWRKGERGRRIHYHLWQIWAYFVGRKLEQTVHFDLIHHITYASYWTPSFLSLLPVPFIWGPVGGGEN